MKQVDADFALTGPNHRQLRQPIAVAAATLFHCLVDGPAWAEWLGIEVEWTSPEPFGVGTTRTVTTGGQVIEETFLAWDADERMNFRFERCTLPVTAFGEDYRIEPRGPNACTLVWSYAYEWDAPLAPLTGAVFATGFGLKGRRALSKLRKMLEEDPSRFA